MASQDNNISEMELIAQNELSRLHRQYRIMEGDKHAFTEEAHIKLAKQRKVIETLQKEQQSLLTDLKVASSKIHKRKDMEMTKQLNMLLKKHEKLSQDINKEKARLNELISQLRKIDKQIFDLKSKEITDLQWQDKMTEGQKAIKSLETKLDVSIKKYCSSLTENQKLREEIDHLLKERKRHNTVMVQLYSSLKYNKKYMMDLVEQAILAFDQREEWGSKLQELRYRLQNDMIIHTQEMRELQRKLDHDTKLKEFLTTKGQRRVMRDLEAKEVRKKEQERLDKQKQLDTYKKILEKIQEFIGEKEIHKLIKCYIKQEEENFALFNYVNELNHELELLTENLSELNRNLDEQKSLSEQRALQQKDTVETLKIKLEITEKEADEEEKKLIHAEDELKALLNGVNDLFQFLKCDIAPILDLLGENPTVNDYNVMLFLGLLEKKVAELAKILIYKETIMERKTRAALNLLRKDKIPISSPNSPREI